MKKNIYKNISLAVLTLFATACQNNDDFSLAYDNDPDAVIVNAGIGTKSQTRVSTESATADKWDNGDAFTLRGGATNRTATYTYDGAAWTVGSDYLTWNSTGTNDFKACYPTSSTYTAFTLPFDQSSGISSADWMTASVTGVTKPADKQLNLQFSHKLTKVIINVTEYGSDYGENAPAISNVRFNNPNNLASTGATLTGGINTIKPFVSTQNSKPCYTAIVLPGTFNSGATFITMRVTPSGGTAQDLKVIVPEVLVTTGLVAGKVYIYNLKVGKGGLSVKSVSINERDSENMGIGEAGEKTDKYKIGDLYPDDVNPVGVVFAVSSGGHGKIISKASSSAHAWSTKSTFVDNLTSADGAVNTATIKTLANWENDYPAFKWCASLTPINGKEWYLPSKEEWEQIFANIDVIHAGIVSCSDYKYFKNLRWWTSTQPSDATKAYAAFPYENGTPVETITTFVELPKNTDNGTGKTRAALVF